MVTLELPCCWYCRNNVSCLTWICIRSLRPYVFVEIVIMILEYKARWYNHNYWHNYASTPQDQRGLSGWKTKAKNLQNSHFWRKKFFLRRLLHVCVLGNVAARLNTIQRLGERPLRAQSTADCSGAFSNCPYSSFSWQHWSSLMPYAPCRCKFV